MAISPWPTRKSPLWAKADIADGRAGQFLEIEDLNFHDLRQDGISRLFEMGESVARVASVSGHRPWVSLERYTHIRQRGDKYAGWQ